MRVLGRLTTDGFTPVLELSSDEVDLLMRNVGVDMAIVGTEDRTGRVRAERCEDGRGGLTSFRFVIQHDTPLHLTALLAPPGVFTPKD